MTRETERQLAEVFNPFWRAARVYEMGLKNPQTPVRALREFQDRYQDAQTALAEFLDKQRTESAGFGRENTPPPAWVGPIRGHLAEIAAKLRRLEDSQQPHRLGGRLLQIVPA